MDYDLLKKCIDDWISGRIVPTPRYGEPFERHAMLLIENNAPEARKAYQEIFEEKINNNNPDEIYKLLRLTRTLHDNQISRRFYAWAYPHRLSQEFFTIHPLPSPENGVGVEAIRLFDETQIGYGFYVELMERTPHIEIYKMCMEPLAYRELSVFNDTVQQTIEKFHSHRTAIKRLRTTYENAIRRR